MYRCQDLRTRYCYEECNWFGNCPALEDDDKMKEQRMSRWIDVDALIEFIENRYEITWESDSYEGGIKDACTDILKAIDDAPSIDFVQCKDCKWHTSDDGCTSPHWDSGQDLYPKAMDYDFCSHGERGE